MGNNYRQIVKKYENVLNNHTCVYDESHSNMDIITVTRDINYVREGFKNCVYYTNNEIEDVINGICLHRNVKFSVFLIVPLYPN